MNCPHQTYITSIISKTNDYKNQYYLLPTVIYISNIPVRSPRVNNFFYGEVSLHHNYSDSLLWLAYFVSRNTQNQFYFLFLLLILLLFRVHCSEFQFPGKLAYRSLWNRLGEVKGGRPLGGKNSLIFSFNLGSHLESILTLALEINGDITHGLFWVTELFQAGTSGYLVRWEVYGPCLVCP